MLNRKFTLQRGLRKIRTWHKIIMHVACALSVILTFYLSSPGPCVRSGHTHFGIDIERKILPRVCPWKEKYRCAMH